MTVMLVVTVTVKSQNILMVLIDLGLHMYIPTVRPSPQIWVGNREKFEDKNPLGPLGQIGIPLLVLVNFLRRPLRRHRGTLLHPVTISSC